MLERFEKLVEMHEAWDVEAYSIAHITSNNSIIRVAMRFAFNR